MKLYITSFLLLFVCTYVGASDYTKFYIVTSPDSPCPVAATEGDLCLTIQQYATNHSLYSSLNMVVLELQPGNHSLDSELTMSNIESFVMRGDGAAATTIHCGDRFYAGLHFESVREVQISGITFVGCRQNRFNGSSNFVMMNSSFLTLTSTGTQLSLSHSTNVTIVMTSFLNADNIPIHVRFLSLFKCSALVQHCMFSNNMGSGAISISRSTVTFNQSTFEDNSNSQGNRRGGAIYASSSTIAVVDSTFRNNSASLAGAILIDSGKETSVLTIENSNFTDNTARSGSFPGGGGAVYIDGHLGILGSSFISNRGYSAGAVHVRGTNKSVSILQNNFINNTAHSNGGALYVYNREDFLETVMISDNKFINNTAAEYGGALFTLFLYDVDESNISLTANSFIDNKAGIGGGAIFCESEGFLAHENSLQLTENTFIHNTALYCGALYVDRNLYANVTVTKSRFTCNRAMGESGGVICVGSDIISILDSSFSHNSAIEDAGVLYVNSTFSDVTIQGSHFEENRAGGNGGVLHYAMSCGVRVNVNQSSFIANQAIGDGGVMYLTSPHCHSKVSVYESAFGDNHADDRGGVISIIGGSLEINKTNTYNNTADVGNDLRTCSTDVKVSGDEYSLTDVFTGCKYYDGLSNITNPPYDSNTMSNSSLLSDDCTNLPLMMNTSDATSSSHYYISPHGHHCPENFTADFCLTLRQYTSNPSHSSSNAVLEFESGNHFLFESIFTLKHHSFTMKGDSTTITCRGSAFGNFLGFYKLHEVHISGLTFIDCGEIVVDSVDNFILKNCNFQSNNKPLYISFTPNASIVASTFSSLSKQCCHDVTVSVYKSSILVKQSVFSSNQAGGLHSRLSTVTIDQSIFVHNNSTGGGGAIRAINKEGETLTVLNSNFSDNSASFVAFSRNGGAIDVRGSIRIHGSNFEMNKGSNGGAVFINVTSTNGSVKITESNFINNSASLYGGAVHVIGTEVSVLINRSSFVSNRGGGVYVDGRYNTVLVHQSVFTKNNRTLFSRAGALYVGTHGSLFLNQSKFISNTNSRAVFIRLGNTTRIHNSSFINNTGGAMHFSGSFKNLNNSMLIDDSVFSHNSAGDCAVLDAGSAGSTHIIASTFVYNRADSRGGAVCGKDTNIMLSNFSHNSAERGGVFSGYGGTVAILESNFNNNTAADDGGVLSDTILPSEYTIALSSFTNNRAGGNGGVIYTSGLLGGRVTFRETTIKESTFINNHANNSGGVIAIKYSTLKMNESSIYNNTAFVGEAISACYSNISLFDTEVFITPSKWPFQDCLYYQESAPLDESTTTAIPIHTTTELSDIVTSTGSSATVSTTSPSALTTSEGTATTLSDTPTIITTSESNGSRERKPCTTSLIVVTLSLFTMAACTAMIR